MNTNKKLLHSNTYGIDMVRIDAKKRSKVCVCNKTGKTIRTYRMNNVPFYEHQYLSWANLDCCNGWAYDDEYLYSAVTERTALVYLHIFSAFGACDAGREIKDNAIAGKLQS